MNLLRKVFFAALLLFPASLEGVAQSIPFERGADVSIPTQKMETERLPDLNVARVRHATLFLNGELTVIGGHTNGFVPTATAEYFSDGAWHELPTVYCHDDGFAVAMKSGKVLIGGGHEKPLGIGQTFSVEWYNAETHTFEGFGCLDTKRVMASAVEMDSGQVAISGNWYQQDGVEKYNGEPQFVKVKDVAQQRCFPYIFRTSPDNAVIFSALDTVGHAHGSIIVDRLHGEPFTPSLFREWKPVHIGCSFRPADSFIGDEAQGQYAHLFTVCNNDGQIAIALLQGEEFSLLPTIGQVPMEHNGHPIGWIMPVIADRSVSRAYLMGTSTDDTHIIYILGIDYAQKPAVLTLYYTEPLPDVGLCPPVLTAEGNLAMVGGCQDSNFKAYASVIVFKVGNNEKNLSAMGFPWWWIVLGIVLLAVSLVAYKFYRSYKSHKPYECFEPSTPDNGDLMERITRLMEQEKLFLNPELKVADVAVALGTHSRTVSDCIKAAYDCSFTQFINNYRVDYVKKLLTDHPDKKIQEVYLAAGFASETSFFRTFKQITGMTPREWISEQNS